MHAASAGHAASSAVSQKAERARLQQHHKQERQQSTGNIGAPMMGNIVSTSNDRCNTSCSSNGGSQQTTASRPCYWATRLNRNPSHINLKKKRPAALLVVRQLVPRPTANSQQAGAAAAATESVEDKIHVLLLICKQINEEPSTIGFDLSVSHHSISTTWARAGSIFFE